jgi:hypothetical protein
VCSAPRSKTREEQMRNCCAVDLDVCATFPAVERFTSIRLQNARLPEKRSRIGGEIKSLIRIRCAYNDSDYK